MKLTFFLASFHPIHTSIIPSHCSPCCRQLCQKLDSGIRPMSVNFYFGTRRGCITLTAYGPFPLLLSAWSCRMWLDMRAWVAHWLVMYALPCPASSFFPCSHLSYEPLIGDTHYSLYSVQFRAHLSSPQHSSIADLLSMLYSWKFPTGLHLFHFDPGRLCADHASPQV